jgi:hypothetical protein
MAGPFKAALVVLVVLVEPEAELLVPVLGLAA